MGSGCIREGETDRVPLDSKIWFVIVTVKANRIEQDFYRSTISGKQAFLIHLTNLKQPYKIYAVWNGEWSTDLFDMDKTVLIKRLKQDERDRTQSKRGTN